MSTTKFKGTPVQLSHNFLEIGQSAPDFSLVTADLASFSLADCAGKKVVLNIFPSIDTSVCALQMKSFHQKLAQREDIILLSASLDLPFALGRFCAAEGLDNAVTASDFRHRSLAEAYGVLMTDGPLAGLYARAVLVLDENQKIIHAELVEEIAQEPNYDQALAVL